MSYYKLLFFYRIIRSIEFSLLILWLVNMHEIVNPNTEASIRHELLAEGYIIENPLCVLGSKLMVRGYYIAVIVHTCIRVKCTIVWHRVLPIARGCTLI